MIIQVGLSLALIACVAYAFTQRRKSRLISNFIYLIATTGIFFVAFPGYSNVIANALGVGRGADLIFYCWIAMSFLISVNLQFKILSLSDNVVKLTRELAIRLAQVPETGHRDGAATSIANGGSVRAAAADPHLNP